MGCTSSDEEEGNSSGNQVHYAPVWPGAPKKRCIHVEAYYGGSTHSRPANQFRPIRAPPKVFEPTIGSRIKQRHLSVHLWILRPCSIALGDIAVWAGEAQVIAHRLSIR